MDTTIRIELLYTQNHADCFFILFGIILIIFLLKNKNFRKETWLARCLHFTRARARPVWCSGGRWPRKGASSERHS